MIERSSPSAKLLKNGRLRSRLSIARESPIKQKLALSSERTILNILDTNAVITMMTLKKKIDEDPKRTMNRISISV